MNLEKPELNLGSPEKNDIGNLFSSIEEQKAFGQVDAATLPRKGAIEHKKNNILEIRKNNLINVEIIKENPTVYIGSGIDFEYPLLLGARNIILVDPILKEDAVIQKLKEKIKSITDLEPTKISENELCFLLDNGETVKIRMEPTLYGSPEGIAKMQSDEKEQIKRFQPPEKIGMILGFRTVGTDVDEDKESTEKLINGGYILTDNAFNSFFEALTDEEKREYLYANSPKKPIEIMLEKWREKGYDFIPLESEGDSYQYTFLRKNKN